ncbi:MAG: hypothetical protein WC027_00635 [Candidatus Paceibacterota bacterium]
MTWLPNTESIAKQITVRSAVNPSLWACVVISLPMFFACTQVIGWLSVAFFVIALMPVLAFFVSYLFLLFKAPNYLRSEEYQLKAEALRCFGDKDNFFDAKAGDVIKMITNPESSKDVKPQPSSLEQLPNPEKL